MSRFALQPDLSAMLDMPSAALVASVPRRSEFPVRLPSSPFCLARRLGAVVGVVARLGQANEVVELVVVRVVIPMVDVVTFGYRPVSRFPDLLVKASHAAPTMLRTRSVVDAIRPVGRFGISTESDSIEVDRFDGDAALWHS